MLNVIETTGNPLEVEVVRYFKLEGKNYLMYTLNEIDEQNYIKLYALRVNEENKAEKIEDENEWVFVKDQIKVIIKGNKEGNLNIDDQDFSLIENINLSETKAFKLSADFVTLLKANKKEFVKEVAPEVSTFDFANITEENNVEEEIPSETFTFETTIQPEVETTKEEDLSTQVEEDSEPSEAQEVNNFELPSFGLETEPEVNTFELPSFEEETKELATEETNFNLPDLSFDNLADLSFNTNQEEVTEISNDDFQPESNELEVVSNEEDYSSIALPQEEINTEFELDFKTLYEEEKALTEVLKGEISDLRDKLNKITQILSQ